jgi:hypothetical protein
MPAGIDPAVEAGVVRGVVHDDGLAVLALRRRLLKL